jgi:hypothetical protein
LSLAEANHSPKEEGSSSSNNIEDDDGTDQEVPVSSNNNDNVTWKPQDKQSVCEFTHTIAEYSQKRDSGCKKAEYSDITVDDCGNKWRLIVYVNGNGRASNHHLSLFLQVRTRKHLRVHLASRSLTRSAEISTQIFHPMVHSHRSLFVLSSLLGGSGRRCRRSAIRLEESGVVCAYSRTPTWVQHLVCQTKP